MLTIFLILILLYFLNFLLSLNNRSLDKLLPYECGFEPIGDARGEFNIVYYLIGLLYLIFDLEIVLILPWAGSLLILQDLLLNTCIVMIFFILITLAFIFEFRSGILKID